MHTHKQKVRTKDKREVKDRVENNHVSLKNHKKKVRTKDKREVKDRVENNHVSLKNQQIARMRLGKTGSSWI